MKLLQSYMNSEALEILFLLKLKYQITSIEQIIGIAMLFSYQRLSTYKKQEHHSKQQ